MRVVTPGGSAPGSIDRYLLPHEERVITVRQHPAILLKPAALALGGLIAAGAVTNVLPPGSGLLLNLVWWGWVLLLLYFIWELVNWAVDYLVITRSRILFFEGLLTRRVNMMPLAKVTDMRFEHSVVGRLLGYGEYVLESAGQDQALRTIHYVPYPEAIYLEVMGMIFPGQSRDRAED